MAGVVLEVLFVPVRAETSATIRRAVETMDINLHVCMDPEEVKRRLFCHRYDGLIVEHDDETEGILRALRQSPSSRGAIAIDMHDEHITLQSIFQLGANFELVYPLTVDRARRTLHLALGLMMLGRRRYYRHPVQLEATISVDGRNYNAVVSNVSEQGIGLLCEEMPLKAGVLRCTFELPDHSGTVITTATVVWADKTGQAGCRVEQFQHGREEFMSWICRLFHQETSAPIAAIPIPSAQSAMLGRALS